MKKLIDKILNHFGYEEMTQSDLKPFNFSCIKYECGFKGWITSFIKDPFIKYCPVCGEIQGVLVPNNTRLAEK